MLDIYETHPVYGYRRMTSSLRYHGMVMNHKKVKKINENAKFKSDLS
jgi:hypothetical protein